MTGAGLPVAAVQPTGGRPAGSAAVAPLPASPEALAELAPGQVLEARVAAVLADGRLRLITSLGLIDALMKASSAAASSAASNSAPGQVLWLKVEAGGAMPVFSRLALGPAGAGQLSADSSQASGVAAANAAASLASAPPRDQASARVAFGMQIAQAATRQAGPAGLMPAAAALADAIQAELDAGQAASRQGAAQTSALAPMLAALQDLASRLPALRLAPDAMPAALKGLLQALGLPSGGAVAAGLPAEPPVVALLTQLRTRLGATAAALGQPEAAIVDSPRGTALPPPARSLPLQGEAPQAALLAPDAPLADHLADMSARTEAALSRLGLHALANLPEMQGQAQAAERGGVDRSWHWSGDIPLAFGDRTGSAQIAIDRDGAATGAAEAASGWAVRLSFALPDLGAIDARVSLRGEKVGVALWAAEPIARAVMAPLVPVLESRLRQAGLDVADVTLRAGRAPAATRSQASGSLFVDRRS